MDRPGKLDIIVPLKDWGGIERNLASLIPEFRGLGWQVRLISPRSSESTLDGVAFNDAEVLPLRTVRKVSTARALARLWHDEPPDAVLGAKDHGIVASVLAAHLLRRAPPVFANLNNTLSEVLRRPGKRWLARRIYPRSRGLIAVSRGAARDAEATLGLPPETVHVAYNPVITPDFAERRAASIQHPWIGAEGSQDSGVILAAGRLVEQKDFPTLLRAFARARYARQHRLVILGEGPERTALEQLSTSLGISHRVDLPGVVADPVPYMARASLFILSSRYEGLGNVLVEALAAGAPVVSTDCPSGPAEILADGAYGELTPIGDAKFLGEAIDRALATPPARLDYRSGLESHLQQFTPRVAARSYIEFIQQRVR